MIGYRVMWGAVMFQEYINDVVDVLSKFYKVDNFSCRSEPGKTHKCLEQERFFSETAYWCGVQILCLGPHINVRWRGLINFSLTRPCSIKNRLAVELCWSTRCFGETGQSFANACEYHKNHLVICIEWHREIVLSFYNFSPFDYLGRLVLLWWVILSTRRDSYWLFFLIGNSYWGDVTDQEWRETP